MGPKTLIHFNYKFLVLFCSNFALTFPLPVWTHHVPFCTPVDAIQSQNLTALINKHLSPPACPPPDLQNVAYLSRPHTWLLVCVCARVFTLIAISLPDYQCSFQCTVPPVPSQSVTHIFLAYSHFFQYVEPVALVLLTQCHIPEDSVISSITVGTSNLTKNLPFSFHLCMCSN